MNGDDAQMVRTARERAAKLLDDLVRHQAQLDARRSKISEADRVRGRVALEGAIASARRALAALIEAEQVVSEGK